ncbi:hypothetical protein HDV01_003624 [Terramyces sp. JEL0728]|nr:hypothetical protein HDV01_003624 [Terramyces sp. JEL0728]
MVGISQCTLETYGNMVAFIASRNTLQNCLVLGETVPVVEADFKMMEYKPLENFYVAIQDGEIVGAIGLEHDHYILGPWTEQSNLATIGQQLYNHVLPIAKDKKYPHLTFYINGDSLELHDFIVKNGGTVQGNEYGMELQKGDFQAADTNPALGCSVVDPESAVGTEILDLHMALFGLSTYNNENWVRRTKENHAVFGCFRDGKLLSYAIVQIQEDALYLSHIGTYESARGQGSASKLLVYLRGYLQHSEFQKMHLNVQMKNAGAARLYERAGFKVCHKAEGFKITL